MADVKWIKVSTGLYDNRKLKQIRTLPEGDSIVLMWVFLMCLAGNVNENGMIYLTPEIPYTDEMLAEEFRMDISTVRLALRTFEYYGMIEVTNDIICLAAWEKWQSTDRLAEIREYNRLAKQKSRAKKKALVAGKENVNDTSMTSQRGHDTDKEEDKDKEKEREYQSINLSKEEPKKEKRIDRLIDANLISDIKDQINFEYLTEDFIADDLELAVSIIADFYTANSPQEFNGRRYSVEFVQQRSMEIKQEHIEYVFECFQKTREYISNIRAYMRTAIFNAPDTIGSYYANKVRADGAVF